MNKMRRYVMELLLALALVSVLCTAGCARHYTITLSNGNKITAKGKPKYDPATRSFRFVDTFGRSNSLPAFRIKEIAAE